MKIWVDGQPHTLRQQVTVLGRDPRVDIAVLHAEVSRKHCFIIELGPERYLLMDFKSANGTRLNGKKIEAAEIRDGDQIDLGGAILTVEGEHRRQSSTAATGHFKSLLQLESARGARSEEGHLIWSRRLDEVAAILPMLEGIRRAGDLDAVCIDSLEGVVRCLKADRGLLLLLDEDTSSLRLRCELGYPGGRGIRKNLHQVLIDEAVDNDRIVATRSRYFESILPDVGTGWVPDVSSAMAGPVSLAGVCVGAFYLDRKGEQGRFRSKDRELFRFLLQILGSQLGVLLLGQRIRKTREHLEIVDVFLSRSGEGNCEVCGEDLDPKVRDLVKCAECQTPYHLDCWEFLGKCSIYACESHLALASGKK